MLDESLAILEGLWSGEPFAFEGAHFDLREVTFRPRPLQLPRIPIWVVGAWPRDPGAWPRRKSMRRAIRYDRLLPNVFGLDGEPVFDASSDEALEDLRAMRGWVDAERVGRTPYDIVVERGLDELSDAEARAETARWEEAGATWWLDDVWQEMYRASTDPEPLRRRILRGPPRA